MFIIYEMNFFCTLFIMFMYYFLHFEWVCMLHQMCYRIYKVCSVLFYSNKFKKLYLYTCNIWLMLWLLFYNHFNHKKRHGKHWKSTFRLVIKVQNSKLVSNGYYDSWVICFVWLFSLAMILLLLHFSFLPAVIYFIFMLESDNVVENICN